LAHRSTLQHTATAKHRSALQHTAAHHSTLQNIATRCHTLQHTATHCNAMQHTATHCNTLQHTAAHCNAMQHTAPHCTTLQQIIQVGRQKITGADTEMCVFMTHSQLVTHSLVCHDSFTVQRAHISQAGSHTATHCNTLQHTAAHCNTLQHTATYSTHCNKVQRTQNIATYCNALQHTTTQCGEHTLAKLVDKISGADTEMAELRAGLKWFFYKHMKAEKVKERCGFGGGQDLPSGKINKGTCVCISRCLFMCLCLDLCLCGFGKGSWTASACMCVTVRPPRPARIVSWIGPSTPVVWLEVYAGCWSCSTPTLPTQKHPHEDACKHSINGQESAVASAHPKLRGPPQ